jgi:hypothetical protein
MLGVFGWRLRKEQSYIPCQFQVMLKVIQTKMTRMMAMINTHLCQLMDLGAIMTFGATSRLIGHTLRTFRPPFPVLFSASC